MNLQIQGEMEQLRVEILHQEQDHGSLLRDIDEQQKETESQAEDYENGANIINKILDEIKTGLAAINVMGLLCANHSLENVLEWCNLTFIIVEIETVLILFQFIHKLHVVMFS